MTAAFGPTEGRPREIGKATMPEPIPAHRMTIWYDHRDVTREVKTPGARSIHDSVQFALADIFAALYVDPVELFLCEQDRRSLTEALFAEAHRGLGPPDLRPTVAGDKVAFRVLNCTTGSVVHVLTWPWLSQGTAVLRGDFRRHCFPSNVRCCHV